jgi:insulysin
LGYIAHLIGQEGTGSLSAVLKRKHWAESVSVGGYNPTKNLTFFKMRISLTFEGFLNLNDLVKHIFQVLNK